MKDFWITLFATFLSVLLVVLGIACKIAIPVFIVFLVLKLVGVITFGWFYVFLPLIIMAVAYVVIVVIKVLEEI